MPRVMKCRHCGEDLYCRGCGERQTPQKAVRKTGLNVSVGEDTKELIEENAKAAGMSTSEYVRLLIKTGRRLADGTEAEG